ncbi:MAG TPA: alanine racemase [Bryobacteraceae bacterium]|nr:alanine racemase [Bryobacteraceae bacterium]
MMHISDLDTPAILIDVDVMERNVRGLAEYCREHALHLRPHTKTHKIPELAQMQLRCGAVGITVAKVGEAEAMADGGIQDILIVYPLLGPRKLDRLAALARRARVTAAIDSFEVASCLSSLARRCGVPIGVRVEFDTGFGRCGLPIETSSVDTARAIRDLPGLEWRGLNVYPGHIMHSAAERPALIERENERLAKLLELADAAGLDRTVVSGGNTPAAYESHRFTGVTEIRPGTYIFNDKNTVCAEAATYDDCAFTVLTRVVSRSVPGKAIVDAGSKTLSGDLLLSGDRHGYGHVLGYDDVVIEDLSEEHGHLNVRQAERQPCLGELIRIVPNHVCPCINLHDRVYGVRNEEVVEEWVVAARGKVQ